METVFIQVTSTQHVQSDACANERRCLMRSTASELANEQIPMAA
jgi:hypothetical protein